MFWERLQLLCKENKTTPTGVVREIGLSHGAPNKWKKGAVPGADAASKIAKYFGVSVEFLLGKTDNRETTTRMEQPLSLRDKYILSRFEDMSDEEVSKALDYLEKLKNQDNQ